MPWPKPVVVKEKGKAETFGEGILKAGAFLSYVCLVGMLLLLITDPIMRYIVGAPFFWSNEMTALAMVLMVFLGLGMTQHKGKNIRVTLVFNRLPARVQQVMWILICLGSLFLIIYVGRELIRLALFSYQNGTVFQTSEFKAWPFMFAAALGWVVFFLAMVMYTIKRVDILRGARGEDIEKESAV